MIKNDHSKIIKRVESLDIFFLKLIFFQVTGTKWPQHSHSIQTYYIIEWTTENVKLKLLAI